MFPQMLLLQGIQPKSSNSCKVNFLFPIYSGSEFRQFYISGIVKELLNKGHKVYSMLKDDYPILISEVTNLDAQIIILKYIDKDIRPTFYTYIIKFLRIDFERNFLTWKYGQTNSLRERRFIDKLTYYSTYLLNDTSRKALMILANHLARKIKLPKMKVLLSGLQIDRVVLNTTRSEFTLSILVGSLQVGIPVIVLYHTNKEAIAQSRILYPYKKLGVWNNEMKEIIELRNKFLLPPISIIGNTHFCYLFKPAVINSETFLKEYDITDDKSIIILYTAASTIVQNEQLIVEKIYNVLSKIADQSFHIIVRKNPMDNSNNWDDYFEGFTNISIQKPKWIMDEKAALNFSLSKDTNEYNALLSYCDICINLPSTVTLEAAIKKKPIINIAYDFPQVSNTTNNKHLSDFWETDYYKPYHKYDFVIPVFSNEELEKACSNLNSIINKEYFDFCLCVEEMLGKYSFEKSIEFLLDD